MCRRRLGVGRCIALVLAASAAGSIVGATGCDGAAVGTCASMPDAPECQPDMGPDAARDADRGPQDDAEPPICALMPRLPGCRDATPDDAGLLDDDASRTDASRTDASLTDASPTDASLTDAGVEPLDAGREAGAPDAASLDAGPLVDAGGFCPRDVPCTCAPGTRLGCAPGDHCVLLYGDAHADGGITATRCVEQGGAIAGISCDPEEPRCVQFFQCTENWMSDRVCLHICETSADCGIGLMCHPSPEQGWAYVGGHTYGVCLPRPP